VECVKRVRTGKGAGQSHDRGMTGGSGSSAGSGPLRALLDTAIRPALVAATDPYAPGSVAVYRLFNLDGALLYVGVSDTPKRRFAQHAHDKGWWYLVVRWTVEWYPDRVSALAEEARLILEEVPAFNVAGIGETHDEDAELMRWTQELDGRRPTARDLDELFLAMVTARSLPDRLWPSPTRRRWDPARAFNFYVDTRARASRWSIARHRAFIDAWNESQERASGVLRRVR
jgi:hypothetical protein